MRPRPFVPASQSKMASKPWNDMASRSITAGHRKSRGKTTEIVCVFLRRTQLKLWYFFGRFFSHISVIVGVSETITLQHKGTTMYVLWIYQRLGRKQRTVIHLLSYWLYKKSSQKLIRHFHIPHNALCLRVACPPNAQAVLHRHCFQFLSGLLKVPREDEDNAYVKLLARLGGKQHANKVHYGGCGSGEWWMTIGLDLNILMWMTGIRHKYCNDEWQEICRTFAATSTLATWQLGFSTVATHHRNRNVLWKSDVFENLYMASNIINSKRLK